MVKKFEKPITTTINKKKNFSIVLACIVLIVSIVIKVVSLFPDLVERYYSRGIYPGISWFYRLVFGWLPFSFGDIFYFLAGCVLLWRFLKFIKVIVQGRLLKLNYAKVAMRVFFVLALIYIYFNLSWGLNYNRPGIASQLALTPQKHSIEDLKFITTALLDRVNENRRIIDSNKIAFKSDQLVFEQAQQAFRESSKQFTFLNYETKSVKKSLYGKMGNLLGFLGYYNPFTGEAQLNLTMPKFLIPYVSCHEMAHQLGYASESEANFVGYLAAVHSNDKMFHYSTYFDLFNYANHELLMSDSIAAKANYRNLDTLVKTDIVELKEYWRKSNNPIEPIIKVFYDHYLKANQQAKGIKSYNEVIGWLIAYYKKYGKI